MTAAPQPWTRRGGSVPVDSISFTAGIRQTCATPARLTMLCQGNPGRKWVTRPDCPGNAPWARGRSSNSCGARRTVRQLHVPVTGGSTGFQGLVGEAHVRSS